MCSTVPPKIYEILNDAVNGDIENFECSCDPLKKGEGFSGETFFVTLQHKTSGKELHLVVKQALPDTSIREFHPVGEVFANEINFYSNLWPKFMKFQEKIPESYRFNHLPKCLATISEEHSERLVLENLSYQGFAMHDKKKPLEKEKFELIFKLYGRFHAISFAYKALNPEEFSELSKGIIDVWSIYLSKKLFHDGIKIIHQQSLDTLDPGVDDAVIEKFKHYVEDGVDMTLKSLDNGMYNSVVHGDCWSNNMMFKYDDSGKLIDLGLLDFQNLRFGSPVCDLSYCLYSGGTKEIYDDLDHLLQVYHDSFSESLRAFGCNPDELYPLEALKKDWKVYGQLGLTMGLMLWRLKLTYDKNNVDLTDLSESQGDATIMFEADYDKRTFKERARDIILHFYENNYLF